MNKRAGLTGLVVEDEWLLRLELAEELGRAGWGVAEAAHGEEALARLANPDPVDFLVTDIRLPGGVDGWAVAEAARRRNPLMPIIYVSANPLNAARQMGGSAFLGKPVDLRLLLEACDRLVLGG